MSQGNRRLSNNDVRAIFESVHDGTPPPSHLPFQVVAVGRRGLKLSPPPFEFPDGLYLLVKHQNKKKRSDWDEPEVPTHLVDLILDTNSILNDNCPWSLSGPQFPQPTAIQQRYCYPKGRKEYSDKKGGALWTMHDGDHNEDFRYRLLHVYYSAKRAVNKGNEISFSELSDTPARKKTKINGRTPPRNILAASPSTLSSRGHPKAFSVDGNKTNVSPIPVHMYSSSPQAYASSSTGSTARSNFVTPIAHDMSEGKGSDSVHIASTKSQNTVRPHNRLPPLPPSPFSQTSTSESDNDRRLASTYNVPPSSPIRSSQNRVAKVAMHPYQEENMQGEETGQLASLSWGSFSFDQEGTLSFDEGKFFDREKDFSDAFIESSHHTEDDQVTLLAKRLDAMHEDVKEQVRFAREERDKERMLAIISKWAKKVAQQPLGNIRIREELN